MPDVVLPSLRQPLPRVALVIDTSGSMSDGMLGQALGEVGGVLKSLGVGRRDLRIVCCDAEAYEAQSVRDLGRVELPGGGGTDMRRGVVGRVGAAPEAGSGRRPHRRLHAVAAGAAARRRASSSGLMDEQGQTPDWADTVLVGEAAR